MSSYLPIAAVIVAAIAIILSIVAISKASSGKKAWQDQLDQLAARVEAAEGLARNASIEPKRDVTKLAQDVNVALGRAADAINAVREDVATLKEQMTRRPAPAAARATTATSNTGPATAGPDEYIVKSGDTGVKIAQTLGIKLSDLMSVNPDVNWSRLHVGQKIKTPAK